ncbi:MAG: MoaD/ThiS family protein [Treponema sp.]|nr:MoaD/ThiS family protein [Treponema sp.]
MPVTVKYRAHLATLTGTATEEIEAATVKDVLRHVKTRFGTDAEKQAKVMLIAVNGKTILQLSGFKTALGSGDEVCFFPICGGG